MIRYNIDHNRVDGLYIGGSTGESFMLSTEERERVIRLLSRKRLALSI